MSKKRGNNEGSVYKRKDGPGWRGAYTVQTIKGPRRRYVSGRTRAETAAKLAKAMSDGEDGLVFDAGKLTVAEYLERWLTGSVKNSVREVTFESYERLVRKHIIPALGRNRLKDLTPVHLRDFHQHKLTEGLSSRTVRYLHAVLHKALKQAADDGLIPRNAAASAKPPQLRQAEIRPLSPTQAKAFLEAAHGDRMEALYVLAITAGLRQGELLGLEWEDVDLEGGTLQVKRTLSNGIFTAPKTAKSRRSVKLTTRALEILKHHRQCQLEERDRMANLWVDHGLVFATEVGTPMNRHNLNARSFKPLLKRAGLPDRRFHDLRHTCATLLLSKGVHSKFVQELLGHATIAVTLDTYSHVLPGMGNQAANAMEDVLS